MHLGIHSNIVAKLQELRFGLLLTWTKGYCNIICELDARVMFNLIKIVDVALHLLGSLISDIMELKKNRV